MVQVNKEVYRFEKYNDLARFASYFYQLKCILVGSPNSILEIGTGSKFIESYLKDLPDIVYTSCDFAEDLKPDVVADVRNLPFKDSEFDVVCAFEVLEHLPFIDFDKSLSELARVSKGRVVISLPHFGPPIKLLIKLPFIQEIKLSFKIPFMKKHVFNGEHYWEIGKMGYSVDTIKSKLSKYFTVEDDFVPFENQYHHFFILNKK